MAAASQYSSMPDDIMDELGWTTHTREQIDELGNISSSRNEDGPDHVSDSDFGGYETGNSDLF